jgi:hypothetical protein
VTLRVGATARDGSHPGRRRRGIASTLVRVRRPHRQQAPFQRVCGRGWRECNHLASHSAIRERRQLELRAGDNREPRFWCVGLASAWRRGGRRGWRLRCPRNIPEHCPLPLARTAQGLPDGPSQHCLPCTAKLARTSANQEAGFPLAPRQGNYGSVSAVFGSIWHN